VNFDFPYQGGSKLTIILRKKNKRLDAAIFQISKGQFSCSFNGCSGAIRFDKGSKKGKVEKISLGEAASHDPTVLFANNEEWFLKQLRSSSKLTIELPFYQYSGVQFNFQIPKLNF
jgi:hypothetical protein